MTDAKRIEQLDEMVISLQAEVSALKKALFEYDQKLADRQQALADQFLPTFLEARRKNLAQ